MKEHNGKNPQNARININYSGKKPKVNFSYPIDKKNSRTRGSMGYYFFMGWLLLAAIYLIIASLSYPAYSYEKDLPYESIENYNISNKQEFLKYYLQEERFEYKYELYNKTEWELVKDIFSSDDVLKYLIIFFGWAVIYYPFKKKWDSLYPDFQALTSFKKYRKFTTKDIQKKDNRYFVELPVFNNVVCDFKAKKDFSKYLEEFDIREHNFKYLNKRKCKKTKKKKRFKNEYIFYARWYFKNKPKKGELEVIFK